MNRDVAFPGQILEMRARGGVQIVKVLKVNPKNIKVETEDGTVWNCHPALLDPTTASFHSKVAAGAPMLTLGTVVRFKEAVRNKYPLLVVVANHAGSWRLAPLGGDKGHYYRGIQAHELEAVNFNLEGV